MLDFINSYGSTTVYLGNGDGAFSTGAVLTVGIWPNLIAAGDFNDDGVTDFVTGDLTDRISVHFGNGSEIAAEDGGNGIQTADVRHIDLRTQTSARRALSEVRERQETISIALGDLGAVQSRLAAACENLQTSRENTEAARSRIVDADISMEAAELTRSRIVEQVGAAILAQANQEPGLALALLRGGG